MELTHSNLETVLKLDRLREWLQDRRGKRVGRSGRIDPSLCVIACFLRSLFPDLRGEGVDLFIHDDSVYIDITNHKKGLFFRAQPRLPFKLQYFRQSVDREGYEGPVDPFTTVEDALDACDDAEDHALDMEDRIRDTLAIF